MIFRLIKDQLHKVSKLTNAPTYKHIEVFDFNIEKNSMKSAIQGKSFFSILCEIKSNLFNVLLFLLSKHKLKVRY